MKTRFNPRLPKEHGAWAMLYVPMIVGFLTAGAFSASAVPFILSATALFVARESLAVVARAFVRGRDSDGARKTAAVYLAAGAAFGLPLVLGFRLYGLVPFALLGTVLLAVSTEQAADREDRSVFGEILAIVGLSMTAPAGYYVARGAWDATALWLWALCAAYFIGSVFYVKFLVLSVVRGRQGDCARMRRFCAAYHVLLPAALIAGVTTGHMSEWVLVAFAPVVLRAFWSMFRPVVGKLNLKRVGVLEIVYSVIFLIFTTLTFH